MKNLFFFISLLIASVSQAQVTQFSFFKIEDGDMWGQNFINTQKKYYQKFAQEAKNQEKISDWSVWRLRGPSYSDHDFVIANSFKTIEQATTSWNMDLEEILGIEGSYLWDNDNWIWIENQMCRSHTGVQGDAKFVVITYINDKVWEHLNNAVDYNQPILEYIISKEILPLKSYSVQTLIYPTKTKDNMKMFIARGYENYTEALSSLDYLMDFQDTKRFEAYQKVSKKIHGDKKPEYDTGFDLGKDSYSVIYEKIAGTD